MDAKTRREPLEGSKALEDGSCENYKTDDDSVENLEAIDVHLDAVDMTLPDGVATATSAESETASRRLRRSTTNNMNRKCKFCGRICSSPAVLEEHYSLSHAGKDSVMAVKPPASVSDKIQLRLSRRGSSMKHPSCWVCGRVCSSLAVLKEHFILKHSTEDQSILNDEKLLRSNAFLQRNQETGLKSEKKYSRSGLLCDHCGKVCNNLLDLSEHSLVHGDMVIKNETEYAVEDIVRQYVCDICGKICTRPSALASHLRFHIRDRIHSCTQCGQNFTMKKNLLRHQKKHSGEREFICEHCGRSFMHRASLRDHKSRQHRDKTATETDSLSFRCKRCGVRFSRISLLRKHIVESHRPIAPKERRLCTLCGKSFSCKFTLTMHMRLHTGEVPHSCSQCERSFATRAALRQHMFRHTNSFPHVCSTCGKRFAVPSALANHERVHSVSKPFTCDHCGRTFTQRYHLKQHIMSTHVNNCLLHCSHCGATFSRHLDLKRHSLRIHQTSQFVTQQPELSANDDDILQ